ncbi:cyclic nucleotide-gated channel beta-3 [Lepeophtheirus salmonis]|uniref:cyclic nucleotide-gated channel beta-3 n=1 Tax=Lepeophtheirus salmonis TaxID=72036 RepID=UPI001AE34E52|nr:cyclic nucleotide-gated cation channel beta-3-like [Lepeophtheirus salmonis]XP_040575638.1 cyclic nucleotide-gated cation channel beta-3-like [Lepeophtheirus salmonis]
MIKKLFNWYQCQEEDPGGGIHSNRDCIELQNGTSIFLGNDGIHEEEESWKESAHQNIMINRILRNDFDFPCQSSESDLSSISKIVFDSNPQFTKVEIHPIPSGISPSEEEEDCDIQPPNFPPMFNNFFKDDASSRSKILNSPSLTNSLSTFSSPTSIRRRIAGSSLSITSEIESILIPEKELIMGDKMQSIVDSLQKRAQYIKESLKRAPNQCESLSSLSSLGNSNSSCDRFNSKNLVYEDFNSSRYASKSTIHLLGNEGTEGIIKYIKTKLSNFVDPRGYMNIYWLSLQALIFLYNAWVIPLRAVFPVQVGAAVWWWIFFDYLGDFIHFLDLVFYKRRVLYMENGFWVKNKKRITAHYVRKGSFKYDLLALLPTDLFYFWFGTNFVILRLPRLFKAYAYWEFIERLDSVLAKPYFLRIFKTLNYMLYLIHLNACAYYLFSDYQGIGSKDNAFIYNGEGNAYIRCFYFATKTATSIGKNKKPKTVPEILFMTASWLMGVFIFAILIGDIRDIVGTARRNVVSYQRKLDDISAFMNDNKVSRRMQGKVKTWMNYTWNTHKTFDENLILEFLPLKIRTDVAMRVHYKTLSKVKLFRNCDLGLLKDLVVLLRPVTYLNGEYVCRKGDKGTEMFIIQSGQVHVMNKDKVLVVLKRGSVFGEIALLGIMDTMNRRTADVISIGFSTLFVLKKIDLEKVLEDYPDAQRILNARAKKLIRENELRRGSYKIRRASIFDRKKDPALLSAVMRLRGKKLPRCHDAPVSRSNSLKQLHSHLSFKKHRRSKSADERLLKEFKLRHCSYFSDGSTPYSLLSRQNSEDEQVFFQ